MIQMFTRKPFDVEAVLVEFDKIQQIAEWCRGEVGKGVYKIMGVDSLLDCVMVPLPDRSEKKGKFTEALVGNWIVKNKGYFRVYRPAAFNSTYAPKVPVQTFLPGDTVQVVSDYRSEQGWIGKVTRANSKMVQVDFPSYNAFGKKYHLEELNNITITAARELEIVGEQIKSDDEKVLKFDYVDIDTRVKVSRESSNHLGEEGRVFSTATPLDDKVSVQLDGAPFAEDFRREELEILETPASRDLALSTYKAGQIVKVINTAHTQSGRVGEIIDVDWKSDRGCYVYTLEFTNNNEDGQEFRGNDLELFVDEIDQ